MESNFVEEAERFASELPSKEAMLGKALLQPFTDGNSGSRKLMFSVHVEQSLPLIHSEVPFIMTGYEQGFTDRSSSIIKSDADYEVMDKIFKFNDAPQNHYFLILRNMKNNHLSVVERKCYSYSTETYGYQYDTKHLDVLDVGYEIKEDQILRSSTDYDENMNPENTVNLLGTYVATDVTMEDSIWISESAQKKLSSMLYKKVVININDNDILLNLMGDNDHYKSFPMVGEDVQGGILCAVRREKIEDSLFTQSVAMLQRILMSDDKYTPGHGTVVDIDIFCNNPEALKEKYSNSQVLYVYNDHLRFIKEFVDSIDRLKRMYSITSKELDGELGYMYYIFKQELSGVQFRDQKVYNGTRLEFMVREINVPSIGDKLANRYGGKGVLAKIMPDDQMPRLALTGEPLEILINSSTCINRENVGQWHEMSLTHIGKCITDMTKLGMFDTDQALHEYIKLLSFASPKQAQEMAALINSYTDEEKDIYVQSIIDDGNLIMSIKPISESMSLDMLAELYDAFPYITQRKIYMPQESSTGKIRFVPSRRNGVVGHISMYRLQQYAEEKHSVTSLSSTNLRNENSRNKANKYYKSTHQATPVNLGNMESADMGHLGFENVIQLLMIHSVSPQGRRLAEQLFTEDPYLVNIELDTDSSNRSAEILNAYLKAIGFKLVFEKRRKVKNHPFLIKPFIIGKRETLEKPFLLTDENQKIKDFPAYLKRQAEMEEMAKRFPFMYKPFRFDK